MKNLKLLFLMFLAFILKNNMNAQTLTQTVRGKIVDKNIQTALPGAIVVLMNSNPTLANSTDSEGEFRLEKVPIGRQTFKVNFLGYKEIILSNVNITTGKEMVLNIEMEENAVQINEIVVKDNTPLNKPLNEMSVVSVKTISSEESQKYAASFNDPGRSVSSVAGVSSAGDGGNNIAIRGNSPNGILWRLEGIEVPSPNHFAQVGTSGGGVSIISSQLLNNFDFMTGAFSSEYGNALSGVFDLKLRKGNNEKRESTIQAGFLGIDLATEGPIKKGYKGSYLVNYRYSTLGLLSKLGLDIGSGVQTFQDISFNVFLPTNKFGNFKVFGFGGLSGSVLDAKKDTLSFDTDYKRYSYAYHSNTGATGLNHSLIIGAKTYLSTTLSGSTTQIGFFQKRLDNEYTNELVGEMKNYQHKQTLSSVLNHKFNSKLSLRSGVILTNNQYDLDLKKQDDFTKILVQQLKTKNSMQYAQLFAQVQYRLNDKFTVNLGAHSMYLFLNQRKSIEPRASAKWEFNKNNSFTFGYGLHSQLQTTSVYFSEFYDGNGTLSQQNKNLDFTKAHHFVLGYDHLFKNDIHLKTELYYQSLFNIPIEAGNSTPFSMVNNTSPAVYIPLTNDGTGYNYGAEITLEKFLNNGFYGVVTTSIYNSKYKGSDGVERNTKYNGHLNSTITLGKEIKLSEKRTLGLNLKAIYAGGNWDTPIDLDKSREYQITYYKDNEAFSVQNSAYFRSDLRLSLQTNKRKTTRTISLDVQNVTNRKNVAQQRYDAQKNEIVTEYQSPLLPVLSYKVNF